MMSASASSRQRGSPSGQPYARWHVRDGPYLRRLRLRLEASLGAACAYCGLSREDGVELEFHHPLGRSWTDRSGHAVTARRLSWASRLHHYAADIKLGLVALACAGDRSHHCHKLAKRGLAPNEAVKLYDYGEAGEGAVQPAADSAQPF